MSGTASSRFGKWGETAVAAWLQARGYELLAWGYRCRYGEIDLVASDGVYLCFVEVKARRSARFALARESVDARKQARLRLAAEHYLAAHPTCLQPRFDVAEVYMPSDVGQSEICYLENAFF